MSATQPIEADEPASACQQCEDELEDTAHIVECFEQTSKILCESCWEEWLEENEL